MTTLPSSLEKTERPVGESLAALDSTQRDSYTCYLRQRVDRERNARASAETANAALTASEQLYHGLFQSSQSATLLLDEDGIVLDANPAAHEMFGESLGTLVDQNIGGLVGEQSLLTFIKGEPDTKRSIGSLERMRLPFGVAQRNLTTVRLGP